MGTGNDILGSGMLYCAVEGSDDYKPLGVVSRADLSKVSIENDISEEWCDQRIIIPNELTVNFKLKTKHRRKTFKKWLMAHGYTRDLADMICRIVGKFQGRVTYEAVYLYILTGGLFT